MTSLLCYILHSESFLFIRALAIYILLCYNPNIMNKQNSNKLIKDVTSASGSPVACSSLSRYLGSRVEKLVNSFSVQQEKLSAVKRFAFSKTMMVSAVLTIFTLTTVVALNPVEILAQTRDSGVDNIGFSTDSTSRISIDNNIGISTLPLEERLTAVEITHPAIDSIRFSSDALQATPREVTALKEVLPNKSLSNQTSGLTNTIWAPESNLFNNRTNVGIRTTMPTSPLNRAERNVRRHTFLSLTVNSSGVAGVVITGGTRHESGTTNYRRIIPQGTAITLTAPATVAGVFFLNWTGCDSVTGTGNRTCNLTLNTARTVTANYHILMTLAAGHSHSLAIRTDGTLWAWGANYTFQLGLGHVGSPQPIPTLVGTTTNWRQASAGFNHSIAIRTDGTLWTWGHNNFGQLGLNDIIRRLIPTRVGAATNW